MKIIDNLDNLHIQEKTAVAIGKFDGVHLGHRALIDELIMAKEKQGLATVVFTFSPSPAEFFGLSDNKQIMTGEEKRYILSKLGIDYLIEFPFNKETAATEPDVFVSDILVGKLSSAFIVAGDDLSFGKKGLGNIKTLQDNKSKYGFEVKEIGKICLDGVVISSTEIRRLISINDIDRASQMLGSAYFIKGPIISGNRIGRTIGFPTINVAIDEKKVLPRFGVYFSEVEIDGEKHFGISNIGVKPTIEGENAVSIETYIYDFDKDVYGKDAIVSLVAFRRKEQKFDGIDALKNQLDSDISAGREYFRI